jgi:hypothetical protein
LAAPKLDCTFVAPAIAPDVEVLNQKEVENDEGSLYAVVVYMEDPVVPGKLADVPPIGPDPPSVTAPVPQVWAPGGVQLIV